MLLINRLKFDPEGDEGQEFGQFRINPLAHVDNVFRGEARDADGEGIGPVMADDEGRVGFAAARDFGEVKEVQNLAADADGKARDLLHSVVALGPLDEDAPVFILARSAVDDRVCIGNRRLNGTRRDVLVGAERKVGLDVDHLVRDAREADIGHALDGEKLAAEKGGKVVDFGVRVTGRGDGIVDAEDIAETIVHERAFRAIGQAGCPDAIAQLGPDLRQLGAVELVFHIDGDPGQPGLVHGSNLFDLGHLLDFGFDGFRDFARDLQGVGTRILGDDDRRLDGEGRVFKAAQREEPPDASQKTAQNDNPSQDRTFNRCTCDFHACAPSS